MGQREGFSVALARHHRPGDLVGQRYRGDLRRSLPIRQLGDHRFRRN